jgi:alpha-1,3-mannosyltransferase
MLVKRRPFVLITALVVVVSAFNLYRHYSTRTRPKSNLTTSSHSDVWAFYEPNPKDANTTLQVKAPAYIEAIMNPEDSAFDRLQCSRPNSDRYAYLKSYGREYGKKYFFALLLHESVNLLPRLMGSIVEAMRFLGPENCVLSIVEGRSEDGTYEVLRKLQSSLDDLGVRNFLTSSDVDPLNPSNDRIKKLATLRNAALNPLIDNPDQFSDSSVVIYINDVAACPDDILELIHQRLFQGADMVCAMDWTHPGPEPFFYDVWIARGITGDTFFEITETGGWDRAGDLFWNDEASRARLQKFLPFQVFACWNGATVFPTAAILKSQIRFRAGYQDECFSGEPQFFCKDMWVNGYGKLAVVPTVNLQYTDETGKRIKKQKGYVADLIQNQTGDTHINWQDDPPAQIKCMPSFTNQFFKPWDEGLIRHHPIT